MSRSRIGFHVYPESGSVPEKDFLERFAPSFLYGGTAFPAADLTCSPVRQDADRETFQLTRISDDGLLRYTLHLVRYRNFPVIEWLPELENIGGIDTELIEDFQSLLFSCPAAKTVPVRLQRNLGSRARQDDYLSADTVLHERMQTDVVMECTRGSSSSDWLPFFGIRIAETCFLHFAIGWSGAWKAEFHLAEEKLSIHSGLRKTRFVLHPGEKVRQSSFFIMEHAPDAEPEDAQNVFRHFMRDFHSPHNRKGELIRAPLSFSCGGAIHEPMLLEILDFIEHEKLPFNVLWMDAGWFGGDHEEPEIPEEQRSIGGMANDTLGNWEVCRGNWAVNHIVHPHGLKIYADRARKLGMDFMLWFETETSAPHAAIVREHPEWLLKTDREDALLLNLGMPEVRRWVLNILREKVEQEGVSMIRVDFNVNCLDGWAEADAPDRIGLTETRYIMGFYALWDEIRTMLPDAAIDNCASGGRRNDFESLSRSIPLWRIDMEQTAESHQLQVSELSRWIPQHAAGLFGAPLMPGDDYTMLSLCATGTQISYFPDQMKSHAAWLRKICQEICTVREGFLQNFYHLTRDVWDRTRIHALQCDSLTHERGLVIIFRRDGEASSCSLPLYHIDPESTYMLTIEQETKTLSGMDLQRYCFRLPRKHMVILAKYQRI